MGPLLLRFDIEKREVSNRNSPSKIVPPWNMLLLSKKTRAIFAFSRKMKHGTFSFLSPISYPTQRSKLTTALRDNQDSGKTPWNHTNC